MDIMKLAAQMLMNKMGSGSADLNSVTSALGGLLSNKEGGLDLGGLVAGLQQKGLGSVAASWLGDGDNDPISKDQIKDLFGGDKISQMANQLGADEDSVLDGLSDALPQVVDKSSSGGSLLDAVGGVGGLMDMAKKLF